MKVFVFKDLTEFMTAEFKDKILKTKKRHE